jgi:hypothetical protein
MRKNGHSTAPKEFKTADGSSKSERSFSAKTQSMIEASILGELKNNKKLIT